METNDIIKNLNNLLEYLHDSRNGYQECAKITENARFQNLFNYFSRQREVMIGELEAAVKEHGGAPVTHGSITGALHRAFVDIKNFISTRPLQATIDEIKKGESMTLSQYEEVCDELPLGSSLRQLLVKHVENIKKNLSEILMENIAA